jgi:hypothetical protein
MSKVFWFFFSKKNRIFFEDYNETNPAQYELHPTCLRTAARSHHTPAASCYDHRVWRALSESRSAPE